MKRAFYLAILLAFALGSGYIASADDALSLDQSVFSNDALDESSMTWPMLPGESVHDLARLFYPKNRTLQQQFVAKTLRVNAQTNLKATARFDRPTLLVIPTPKSLSVSATKVSKKSNKQSNKRSLKMSYGLKQASEELPHKLIPEYEELVNKNAFLKQQLAKLSEKITLLQSKLDALKLIVDRTLTLPNAGSPPSEQPVTHQSKLTTPAITPELATNSPIAAPAVSLPPAKKVLKNLNKETKQTPAAESAQTLPAETSFSDRLNMDLVKVALAILALLLLGTFGLKNYRARLFDKLSHTAIKVQPAETDFSGYLEEKNTVKEQTSPAVTQQVKATEEVETRLSATLEEAKLLISVNRATDAIAHLKATIASQPKASISHWLYLLDVFRKFNMKDDFEQYADRLHQTFNVMTPVWYEKSAAIYVPLSLEEFPHIMEQLYGVWPGELAGVYLRSLITDNRGGDRTGFGKEVLDEILMLIALLDTHK